MNWSCVRFDLALNFHPTKIGRCNKPALGVVQAEAATTIYAHSGIGLGACAGQSDSDTFMIVTGERNTCCAAEMFTAEFVDAETLAIAVAGFGVAALNSRHLFDNAAFSLQGSPCGSTVGLLADAEDNVRRIEIAGLQCQVLM